MPTAGRLAGAVVLFLYGWYIAPIMGPLFPENNPPDFLVPLCAVLGLVIGWAFLGGRAGMGYSHAVGNGLTTAFLWSFWTLFFISGNAMIKKALRRIYDGPMEALTDVFALMIEMAQDLFDVNLLVSIIAGGLICAYVTEYFGQKYP